MASDRVIYAVPGMRWLTNLGWVNVTVYESLAADHPKIHFFRKVCERMGGHEVSEIPEEARTA